LAFDPDAPLMRLDEPLADGQAKTCAAVAASQRMVDLIEFIEQARNLVRGNAGTSIADADHHFASLLARDLPADDKRQRFVQAIASGVQDLNRTVTGLLEFTRDRRIARRDTPPGRLAAEVIALVQGELDARTADAAPVTLELADGWRGGPFPLDAAQMKQVLLNLVQNAVHAVSEDRPGGRVRLALTADAAGALVLAVDDDGPGVPEADRATIFTPFFTTRPHGTGLGLAISAAIVQLHGGTIAVETAPLGGARFRVVIPRSGDERTAP